MGYRRGTKAILVPFVVCGRRERAWARSAAICSITDQVWSDHFGAPTLDTRDQLRRPLPWLARRVGELDGDAGLASTIALMLQLH